MHYYVVLLLNRLLSYFLKQIRTSTLQICFSKIFQNKYARVIPNQNYIVVRTGEEARVSAEIRDGAVQSLLPRKIP